MKTNKILIIIIIVLLALLLGTIGYIVYLDEIKPNKSNRVVQTQIIENKLDTSNTSETYKKFVTNFINDREKEETSVTKYYDEYTTSPFDNVDEYKIELTKDGVLSINYLDDDYRAYTTSLDTNVLFYRLVFTSDRFRDLYYVKEDGNVYKSEVEYAPYKRKNLTTSKISGCKDIVNIIPSNNESNKKTNENYASFIDINGNICTYKE